MLRPELAPPAYYNNWSNNITFTVVVSNTSISGYSTISGSKLWRLNLHPGAKFSPNRKAHADSLSIGESSQSMEHNNLEMQLEWINPPSSSSSLESQYTRQYITRLTARPVDWCLHSLPRLYSDPRWNENGSTSPARAVDAHVWLHLFSVTLTRDIDGLQSVSVG